MDRASLSGAAGRQLLLAADAMCAPGDEQASHMARVSLSSPAT